MPKKRKKDLKLNKTVLVVSIFLVLLLIFTIVSSVINISTGEVYRFNNKKNTDKQPRH